jgi:phosphatidylserine/phosphatidylglycerophosphate/cardiolipin synthase-like enzyme
MPESENGLRIETDDRVASSILDIIRNAKQSVTLVCQYLKLWGHIKDQIMMARQKGVKVTVVARDGEQGNNDDVARLKAQDVDVWEVEWLLGQGSLTC